MIKETFAPDWEGRPLSEGASGPGAGAISDILAEVSDYIPDLAYQPQRSLVCGDKSVVISKVTGTVKEPPAPSISILQSVLDFEPGQQEIPLFPGDILSFKFQIHFTQHFELGKSQNDLPFFADESIKSIHQTF